MVFARRGQAGVFTLLFFDLVFIILYALVLAELLNTFIAQGVASGNFVGWELFLLSMLHVWVWIGFIAVNLIGFVAAGAGR
jgi:hypothetical protein